MRHREVVVGDDEGSGLGDPGQIRVQPARRLQRAIDEAYEAGYLGTNILGSGFDLDVTVHLGAGAYICGEETSLISSCEGTRGDPKNRPPFPAQKGYMGNPTCVNNVETFCAVLSVIDKGAGWFAELGSKGSAGTKLLSVAGDCHRAGVYELPFGITIKELLKEVGGEDAVDVGVVLAGVGLEGRGDGHQRDVAAAAPERGVGPLRRPGDEALGDRAGPGVEQGPQPGPNPVRRLGKGGLGVQVVLVGHDQLEVFEARVDTFDGRHDAVGYFDCIRIGLPEDVEPDHGPTVQTRQRIGILRSEVDVGYVADADRIADGGLGAWRGGLPTADRPAGSCPTSRAIARRRTCCWRTAASARVDTAWSPAPKARGDAWHWAAPPGTWTVLADYEGVQYHQQFKVVRRLRLRS